MNIDCTHCGASIPIEENTDFIRCTYCDASLFVETSQTVVHYYVPLRLTTEDVAPLIRRAFAKHEIVDEPSELLQKTFFFPFWRFERNGKTIDTIPAVIPPVDELKNIPAPAGELKFFSSDLEDKHEIVEPALLLGEATTEQKQKVEQTAKYDNVSLVHIPLIHVEFTCQSTRFLAVIDGLSGKVYCDQWPVAIVKERNRALGLVAAVSIVAFTAESALITSGLWLLAAYAVTGGLCYLFAMKSLEQSDQTNEKARD